MATEKLDVVVVLVEVKIEVAAALRAFQQAREYAGLLRDRGLFAARPFLERLHLFPSLAVNDSLMDIEEEGLAEIGSRGWLLWDNLDLLTKWFSKKTVLKKVQEKAVSAIKSTKTGQENQSLFSK